jgi:hypothetical protein
MNRTSICHNLKSKILLLLFFIDTKVNPNLLNKHKHNNEKLDLIPLYRQWIMLLIQASEAKSAHSEHSNRYWASPAPVKTSGSFILKSIRSLALILSSILIFPMSSQQAFAQQTPTTPASQTSVTGPLEGILPDRRRGR